MFIANFGGLMAMPTDLPYCLVYHNIYSTTVSHKHRHHFNVQGSPPGLCTQACVCHALLQHANLSEAHRQKYHGSHLVIPWGVQYSCLLPKITMLHKHQVVLLQCGSSPFKFKSFSIKFRIWDNSSSSDVLYIQASISISPKYESK